MCLLVVGCCWWVTGLALFCLVLLLVTSVLIVLIWYAVALAVGLCGVMLAVLFGCIWLVLWRVCDAWLLLGGFRAA